MKKIIFIILLCVSSQIFAQQNKSGSTTLFADVLLWKLREGSADNWAQLISPAGSTQTATVIGVPFKWDPGLRIGASYTDPNNTWNSKFYVTHYQTTAKDSASGRVFSAFLGNFYSGNTDGSKFGPLYSNADIRWRFTYNTLDFELGRIFNFNQIVAMQTIFGMKAAFIDQNMFTNWENPSSNHTPPTTYDFTHATEDLKNNYWGIGPTIGLNTTWPIYQTAKQHFNLIGNFAGSLLWSHWRFKDKYKTDASNTITVNSNNINGASTMVAGKVGLEWAKKLSTTSIAIRLTYEAQIWFNQLQFYSYNMGKLNHQMSLQGSTLDFRINV